MLTCFYLHMLFLVFSLFFSLRFFSLCWNHRLLSPALLHSPCARCTVKDSAQPTVGVDFGTAMLTLAKKQVKLQIWDMAGQERFRAVTTQFFRGAAGGLLVYDIASRESFSHIVSWLTEARSRSRPEAVFALVGAKSDLAGAREVPTLEAAAFAQDNDLLFIECSARTGDNVDELFTKLTAGILRKAANGGAMDETNNGAGDSVDLSKQDEAAATCKC